MSAPPKPSPGTAANLTASAYANSFYVAAAGQGAATGSFEVIAPQNSPQGQLVPIEVIGAGDTRATGTGWSYSQLLVYGFGANDTFPLVEAEGQTNYAYPQTPGEGSIFNVDQTIMLEPNTVGTVSEMIEAYAGEPQFQDVSATPFAKGCPTYCGMALAYLDPEIEIAPAFLAANPGYELVFSPGFLPPSSGTVPESPTWVMLALGFAALGALAKLPRSRRASVVARLARFCASRIPEPRRREPPRATI